MNRNIVLLLGGVALLLLLGSQSIFFVAENERAIVLQLGEAVEGERIRQPGLNFKLPFIQTAVYFEDRILVFEIEKTESLTADLKVLEIDNYVCWRITDPTSFYRSMRSEAVATERLRNIVYSQLRTAIGNNTLNDIVFTEGAGGAPADESGSASPARRSKIMGEVLTKSDAQAKAYGVTIVDVRIKRLDLPNRLAIFKRMNAERLRMAKKYRSEGESEKLRIRSEAEMQRDNIIADANRQSIIIRGEADAKAIEIFAGALSKDPEFYEFSKSLELYRNSLKENSRVIFSSDDPLLKYMN